MNLHKVHRVRAGDYLCLMRHLATPDEEQGSVCIVSEGMLERKSDDIRESATPGFTAESEIMNQRGLRGRFHSDG